MGEHILSGFGFGPIQAGLFAKEAFESGNFGRIVVAEVDARLVEAVRSNSGSYYVNVAGADGTEALRIDGVELLNPNVGGEREALLEALGSSTEIVTCLPSVQFYSGGGEGSVAGLIAEGLSRGENGRVIYTAENNNHAAEILERAVGERAGRSFSGRVQFLNTVIGKMSRVVDDSAEISELGLRRIAPGIERAFLVEEFNRILVTRTTLGGFRPGIEVFIEKDELLPFEEAKLYGHNAVHSLLGFLGAVKGRVRMTELKDDAAIMEVGRAAFVEECGKSLIMKYESLGDELFTEGGFAGYSEDLLERITNPYLADTVGRATRDAVRKLGMDDRIFGTMRLALEYGLRPENMALGAAAGLAVLVREAEANGLPAELRFGDWRGLDSSGIKRLTQWLWDGRTCESGAELLGLVAEAKDRLEALA